LQERLDGLEKAIIADTLSLETHERNLQAAQLDVEEAGNTVEQLRDELKDLSASLEEKSKELDSAKRQFDKANKVLEKVLKEISSRVSVLIVAPIKELTISHQNDDIEKLAASRSSIYRKCRLEGIDLPLDEGSLNNVPMEEVCLDYIYP
jgi:structural maintenance of chromosome 1